MHTHLETRDADLPAQGERHAQALVALTRAVWHDRCTLETALTVICETAADALQVPRVNIWRYDPAAGELRCTHAFERAARRHAADTDLETLTLAGSDYIASMQAVRAIDAGDVDNTPGTAASMGALREYFVRHDIQSLLDAPVLSEGRLVGVVCHEQVGSRRAWTREDIAFAGSMGDYVAMAMEIHHRREAERTLTRLRLHDAATDLPNRDYLLELLALRLRAPAQAGAGAALVHLHVDPGAALATAEDADGQDAAMARVAMALRKRFGEQCNLARARADAFALLPRRALPEHEVVHVAEQAVDLVRALAAQEGASIAACAGIAFARDLPEMDAHMLLRNAELACARARALGRHRCEIFDVDHHRQLLARMEMERSLRASLVERTFEVHYQPEVDLRHGACVAAEALVRWRRDGTCLPAGEFIDVAEGAGLIVSLGRWILQRACEDARAWPRVGIRTPVVRVNLSALQLEDPALVDDVAEALARSGLPPHRLCLEITESVLIRDGLAATAVLHKLKDIGVRLAIDDFGTGYSSLAFLKRFPVDTLKVDRSFVAGLPDDVHDLAIVRGVAAIARDIGLDVVAEGVEMPAQARALRDAGIHRVQGWLYSPALDQQALVQRIAAG